jgi:nitrite reductase/ring-hydroxylating ferredoxin subunit
MTAPEPTSHDAPTGEPPAGPAPAPRPASAEPLWREEFSVRSTDERYVSRRQFTKFLVLTSAAMFAGNLWLLVKSLFRREEETFPHRTIARASEVPVGGVKLFAYPEPADRCILIRRGPDEFVAFSQKCTHLSCAVYYARERDRLECPCHEGYFSAKSGRVLQGPPPRALPRVRLVVRGDSVTAVGVERGEPEEG